MLAEAAPFKQFFFEKVYKAFVGHRPGGAKHAARHDRTRYAAGNGKVHDRLRGLVRVHCCEVEGWG